MSRVPLPLCEEDHEPKELPCECCSELTTHRISLGLDDVLACCMRQSCKVWVTELLHKID